MKLNLFILIGILVGSFVFGQETPTPQDPKVSDELAAILADESPRTLERGEGSRFWENIFPSPWKDSTGTYQGSYLVTDAVGGITGIILGNKLGRLKEFHCKDISEVTEFRRAQEEMKAAAIDLQPDNAKAAMIKELDTEIELLNKSGGKTDEALRNRGRYTEAEVKHRLKELSDRKLELQSRWKISATAHRKRLDSAQITLLDSIERIEKLPAEKRFRAQDYVNHLMSQDAINLEKTNITGRIDFVNRRIAELEKGGNATRLSPVEKMEFTTLKRELTELKMYNSLQINPSTQKVTRIFTVAADRSKISMKSALGSLSDIEKSKLDHAKYSGYVESEKGRKCGRAVMYVVGGWEIATGLFRAGYWMNLFPGEEAGDPGYCALGEFIIDSAFGSRGEVVDITPSERDLMRKFKDDAKRLEEEKKKAEAEKPKVEEEKTEEPKKDEHK